MKRPAWLASVCAVLVLLGAGATVPLNVHPQADDPLVLVTTIEVGGRPNAIVVDGSPGHNEAAFYDESSSTVRFIDGETLTLAPEEITLSSWQEVCAVYDRYHHQVYLLTTKSVQVWADGHYDWWEELSVHVIAGRSHVASLKVNEAYNTDPTDLADGNYAVEGVALKQPMSEGDNPGRLIIDNPWTGNIDVVDLNAAGTLTATLHRYSYRDPLSSSWRNDNPANSLALESRHETLGSDDLTSTDILYIADKHHPMGSYLHALWLTHPLEDLSVTRREDISLGHDFRFSSGTYGGLAVAEERDTLYVGCTAMSFENGFVGKVDTNLNQLTEVLPILGGVKEGIVLADWYDSERVFVCAGDDGWNDPRLPLFLHLIYGDTVVASLHLFDNYQRYDLGGMAFDPYHRRLYITARDKVMVVQVNYGAGPPAGPQSTPTPSRTPGPILTPPPPGDKAIFLPLTIRNGQ